MVLLLNLGDGRWGSLGSLPVFSAMRQAVLAIFLAAARHGDSFSGRFPQIVPRKGDHHGSFCFQFWVPPGVSQPFGRRSPKGYNMLGLPSLLPPLLACPPCPSLVVVVVSIRTGGPCLAPVRPWFCPGLPPPHSRGGVGRRAPTPRARPGAPTRLFLFRLPLVFICVCERANRPLSFCPSARRRAVIRGRECAMRCCCCWCCS